MNRSILSFVAALLHASLGLGGDWPAWRGPEGLGRTNEANLPLHWSTTENVRWKVPLPDRGNSTPIVWGERVFLTQATEKGKKRATLCLHRQDGRQLWERTIPFDGEEPTHETNYYCSASPATDGEHVVVSHGSAGVFCYDLDGNELWHRYLGPCLHVWGNAASPVIYQDLVILNFGPGERTFLVAMSLKTGDEVWRVDVPGGKLGDKGQNEWIGSWSTPVIARFGQRDELIMSWPGVVKSHDPRTGKVFWECSGLAKETARDRLVYTSPIVHPEVIVAMAGYGGPAIAVKPGGIGDVTETHRLWRQPSAPQRIGTGVIVGDHAYVVDEPGTCQVIEWKTGKRVKNERVTTTAWASLLHAGDRLYVINRDGETVVMTASPELKILARNKLDEPANASIAASNGEFFIRTFKHLWCIRGSANGSR